MHSPLANRLLAWYEQHARRLPWRDQPDPYAIWVSEIMLQQTRVETVKPYYERWMARFPNLEILAGASQQEVLSAWEGMGYYRRAHNLHRAARLIVAEHGGQLPRTVTALRRLPGIGRYTAAAIASIAFGENEPALDGNVRRVLARVFNIDQPLNSKAGEGALQELAAANLPSGRAGDFNQALMDLGATLCTPRDPHCQGCPLAGMCEAHALGVQAERPVKTPRLALPHHQVAAAVIQRDGQVLIAQRPQDGLLGGLWEFPGGKVLPGEDLAGCLRREICEELGVDIQVGGALGVYRHAYTHFRITVHAFHCTLKKGVPRPLEHKALHWTEKAHLTDFPMGKVDRQIAQVLSG